MEWTSWAINPVLLLNMRGTCPAVLPKVGFLMRLSDCCPEQQILGTEGKNMGPDEPIPASLLRTTWTFTGIAASKASD